MENNSGSFDSRGAQDPLSRVHPLVHTVGLLLQQNSNQISNNQPLKNEIYSTINEQVQNALENSRTTMCAYASSPSSFTDSLVLCVALNALLNTQTSKLTNANEELESLKQENNALNERVKDLQANNDEILQQLNNFKGTPSMNRQISDLKQDLQDANSAIKMQQQKYQNEIEQLKQKLQEAKNMHEESESQVSQMQSEDIKYKREVAKNYQIIADAFDVPTTQDGNAMIAAIKQRFLLDPNDTNMVQSILTQIRTVSQKYNQLLGKFNVGANSENPQAEITENVEKSYSRSVLAQLRSEYEIDPSTTDIIDAVHDISANPTTILEDMTKSFDLPEETKQDELVDAIKSKFAGSFQEEESVSPETIALKEENDQLKQKQRLQEMLLGIISTPPVVFERYGEETSEIQTRDLDIENDLENENITHIQNIASDLDEAQKTLEQYQEILKDNQRKLDELTKSRDEQIQAAKREIRNTYKSKLEKLEGIVQALTPNEQIIDQLKRKLKTVSQTNKELANRVVEYEKAVEDSNAEKEALQSQLNSIQQHVQDLEKENDQIHQDLGSSQKLLQKSSEKSEELEKLQQIISDLTMNNQTANEELSDTISQRNDLLTLINKQQQVIVSLEETVQRREEKIDNLQTTQKQESDDDIVVVKRDLEQDDLIAEALSEVPLQNRDDDLNDLKQIQNSEENDREKSLRALILLLTKLNETNKQNQDLLKEKEEYNDKKEIINKLKQMLNQQLSFIEKILSGNDKDVSDDIKKSLTENVARIHDYLEQEAQAFTEESSLFDTLNIRADPLQMKKGLEDLFDQFETIDTDEGAQLLILLRQAVTAAMILKRYASEAMKQCQKSANELKLLKSDMDNFRNECERRANNKMREAEIRGEEVAKEKEDVERKLTGIQNILRANLTNPDALNAIDDCLKELNNGADFNLNEEELQKSVEAELIENRRKLRETAQQLEETKTELEELRTTTTREIEEIQQASGQLQDDAQTIIHNQGDELLKLKDDLKNAKEQFEKMKQEFAEIKQTNDDLKNKLTNEKKRADDAEKTKQEEINRIKEKASSKVGKVMKILAQEQKARIDKLSNRIKNIQHELRLRDEEIQQKDQIILEQNESNEKLSQNCTQIEEDLKQSKTESENTINDLNNKIRELSEQNKSLEVQNKLLNTTLKTNEEKMKREKKSQESESKLKQFKQESEIQKRIDEVNDENNQKNKEFLRQIQSIFIDLADFTKPLNNSSVLHLLSDVIDKMKLLTRDAEKANDYERQIKEIRTITNCSKGMRTTAAVSDLLQNNKELKEQISQNNKEQNPHLVEKQLNDWEEWGKRMHKVCASSVALPSDSNKLRTELETALFAMTSDKTLMNKMDLLRSQKRLLKAVDGEALKQQKSSSSPSLVPVICLLMFTRRLRKIAKVLPSQISFTTKPDDVKVPVNEEVDEQQPKSPKMNSPKSNSKSISSVFGSSVLN